MLRINTNYTSDRLIKNLERNSLNLNKILERLSSGLKINRAADNPVGAVISNKLKTQILSINCAIKNIQDGIILIQTADGGLQKSSDIIQRLRELALQAASDTCTQKEREIIQKEIKQLIEALTEISINTEFNTKKLLNGSFSSSFIPYDRSEPNAYIVKNIRVGERNTPFPFIKDFIEKIVSIDSNITVDTAIEFKLIESTNTPVAIGMEVRSSLLGLITVIPDLFALNVYPSQLGISVDSLLPTASLITVQLNIGGYITGARDRATPFNDLASIDRLDWVTPGNLTIYRGSGLEPVNIPVDPAVDCIDSIITKINALIEPDPLSNYVASFDDSKSLFSINFSRTDIKINTVNSNFFAPPPVYGPSSIPAQVGAPYYNFPALTAPPTGVWLPLPVSPFPPIPPSLDSSLTFGGTSNFVSQCGLLNRPSAEGGIMYFDNTLYTGTSIPNANPSEFTLTHTITFIDNPGVNNDLWARSAAFSIPGNPINPPIPGVDDNIIIKLLETRKLKTSFTPGQIRIDYTTGGGGTDFINISNTDTIQSVIDKINTTGGGNYSASFDDITDRLTIQSGGTPLDTVNVTDVVGNFTTVFNLPAGASNSLISTSDIDNSFIDSYLDITGSNVTGSSLQVLSNPKIITNMTAGTIIVNGNTFNFDPNINTFPDVANWINSLSDPLGSGQVYGASWNLPGWSGWFVIPISDREDFDSGNTVSSVNPVVVPQYAPIKYGGVNGPPGDYFGQLSVGTWTGSGPVGPGSYPDPGPAPPLDTSIYFLGSTSNLFSVLNLPNVDTAGTTYNTTFDGTITPVNHDNYTLTTTRTDNMSSSQTCTSTKPIGKFKISKEDIGQVAVVQILGKKENITTTDKSLTLQVGSEEGDFIKIDINNMDANSLGLETLSILGDSDNNSCIKAQNAIAIIDKANEIINKERSKLGAFQNRLEHTLNSLKVHIENMNSTNNNIKNINLKEMSEYIKNKILDNFTRTVLIKDKQINKYTILSLL